MSLLNLVFTTTTGDVRGGKPNHAATPVESESRCPPCEASQVIASLAARLDSVTSRILALRGVGACSLVLLRKLYFVGIYSLCLKYLGLNEECG